MYTGDFSGALSVFAGLTFGALDTVTGCDNTAIENTGSTRFAGLKTTKLRFATAIDADLQTIAFHAITRVDEALPIHAHFIFCTENPCTGELALSRIAELTFGTGFAGAEIFLTTSSKTKQTFFAIAIGDTLRKTTTAADAEEIVGTFDVKVTGFWW